MTTISPHTSRATGTILTAAIYNFDHNNHVNNATALNAGKIEGVTPPVADGAPIVFSGTGGNAIRAATTADVVNSLFFRSPLTGARTYYVRTDGSDTNTGLVDSAGGAFLTIQKALDVVYGTLDLKGFDVTIQVRDGTFARAVVLAPQVGKGNIILQGNNGTPANVILTATAIGELNGVVDVRNGAVLLVRDFAVNTVTSGSLLFAKAGGKIYFQNIRFGATVHHQIFASSGGYIEATGNYAITAAAASHIWANSLSEVRVQSWTVTITGTPAFSQAFVKADYDAVATLNGNTWSGSATGTRFAVDTGAIIVVVGNLTTLPGSLVGTVTGNGVYDGYAWNTLVKSTIETRASSAALANDGALQFSMAANTTYAIRIKVYYDTAATPGFKFALAGPGAATIIRIARKHISAAALTTLVVASEVAYTGSTSLPGGTTGGYFEIDMITTNGATPGTFAFQWAQDTSNASNTSVNAGSYLEYRKVAP